VCTGRAVALVAGARGLHAKGHVGVFGIGDDEVFAARRVGVDGGEFLVEATVHVKGNGVLDWELNGAERVARSDGDRSGKEY
jgi:hypothetical protein